MATQAGARGIGALWRQGEMNMTDIVWWRSLNPILFSSTGWNEIPEVMGGCVKGVIGIVLIGIGLRNYYANDGDNRKYKQVYVVSAGIP